MDSNKLKQIAAEAAVKYIPDDAVIGVGTGSTVNYFIDALAAIKNRIEGTVASSIATEQRLKSHGIRVFDLNTVSQVPIYIDGADEINQRLQMIKGGGGALTREKILACASEKFICVADVSKQVDLLGTYPLAVEVIPMARSYVARQLVKMGGNPTYRQGFITDNGNIILDVYNLNLHEPLRLESALNNITGVVCHGLFAERAADLLILATDQGIKEQRHPT
ncbi:MAG: ribose-5-phosphate isomerase [Gammaproteobacteria bacterium]|jgi:ribose 5-phosphate isomerase A|nr:ribose-5-phosphate isomerase [Gammaproteobacteria bacterium]